MGDPDDDRLADYRELNDPAVRRRLDHERAVFMVEGRVAVERLLTSSYQVLSLLIDDHQATAVADLVEGVRDQGAPVYVESPGGGGGHGRVCAAPRRGGRGPPPD